MTVENSQEELSNDSIGYLFTQLEADNHKPGERVKCSYFDHKEKYTVPLGFFYKKSIDPNVLRSALEEALNDFSLFAGRSTVEDGEIYFEDTNQGINFAVEYHDCTLSEAMRNVHDPKDEITLLDDDMLGRPKEEGQIPLSVKLNYFEDGGMCVALAWCHILGDMVSVMGLLQAWSAIVEKKEYELPLIVPDRHQYLKENLDDCGKQEGSLDWFNPESFAGPEEVKVRALNYYFSEEELQTMKQAIGKEVDVAISKNDALCAHLMSILAKHDTQNDGRHFNYTINYRERMGLPKNLFGNMISSVTLHLKPNATKNELAKQLRESLNQYQEKHFDYWANARFVAENGGIENIDQFALGKFAPFKGDLFMTNWSKMGVVSIRFGQEQPQFITMLAPPFLPGLLNVFDGPSGKGLIFYLCVQDRVADQLTKESVLKEIHQYRNSDEQLPELIQKEEWIY